MAQYPYQLVLSSTLAALATGTMNYPIPNNEGLQLGQLYFVSTGAFSITDIRDSAGKHYTNASPSNPIPSTLLQNAQTAYESLRNLPIPIVIEGGKTLYVDIVDTSNAPNTVKLLFNGIRDSGS